MKRWGRVVFAFALTALLSVVGASPPAQAAEDPIAYRTSCQAVLKGETNGQVRTGDGKVGIQYRCFLSHVRFTAAQLSTIVSNLRPTFYAKTVGSGRVAFGSGGTWTVNASGHGDMIGSDGAGTTATDSSLPDNYIYFDGVWTTTAATTTYESFSLYGTLGTFFGADGTPASTFVSSPSTEKCAEISMSGWANCDTVMDDFVGVPWGYTDLEDRYSTIEDLGRGGLTPPLPEPPDITCSRFWNEVGSGELEITYLVSYGTTPPLPTTASFSVAYDVGTVTAGAVFEATVGRFRQRVTMDRDDPRTVATITVTLPEFDPDTVTCELLVDERFPDVSDPEEDPDGNDSYGCPTGWGLINPTNTLQILKCLFIPRESFADEFLGTSDLEDPTSITEGLDDTSIYYPVALVGAIGLDMVDQVTVESVGTCRLVVGWSGSHIGHTGSPHAGLPNVGDAGPLNAFGQNALVNTNLCPAGSPWVTAVELVRTVSFIVAATAGLWMAVRFVKNVGAYKNGPGAA